MSAALPSSTQSCRRRKPSSSSREAKWRGSRSSRSIDGSRPRARSSSTNWGSAGKAIRASPQTGGQHTSAIDEGWRSISTATHRRRGGRLHRVEERADRGDVVAHVRDQGHVRRERCDVAVGRRPPGLHGSHIRDPVLRGDLVQAREHPGRRIHGDDLASRRRHGPGDRQGIAARARPDVQPRVTRPDHREQRGQRRFIGPGRVRAEQTRDRRVEVRRVGDLAESVHLLVVGMDAVGP